ncbi:MAG: hypothetical protein ACTTKN_00575 [Phocaeicola sp.]|uniref:hypothetical protein n=1 Tax=Phocaeicola TaxID=909656 RepID=UPI00234E97CD|nr:hypothetical protein [Phocaeicola oris]MCE2615949.1 hypothetical protein [Phocaeicola oris]
MNTDKIRNILNMLFLALAVVAIILYFTAGFSTFIIVCAIAIVVKLIEFFMRFML